MARRRTVRHYSSEDVPQALIDGAIAIAGTAPSGANLQPWRFVVVRDPDVKRRIRHAAEREEREFYETRAPEEWVAALHLAGLATLTHTPSPVGFLSAILDRPRNERPFLLIPVGYPAADAVVPMITKKALDSIRLEV
jgi:nitroreductase